MARRLPDQLHALRQTASGRQARRPRRTPRPDPRGNTRTTYVRWWERLFVAPYNLNYHLEHHILSAVPCYHLPAFHRFLKERGAYEGVRFPRGYGELFAGLIC